MTLIYDKTDKGREEIATRKYQLAPRLRTLLLLVDGKHTADDLLKKVSGLGLDSQSLVELLDKEFIQLVAEQPAAASDAANGAAGTIREPEAAPGNMGSDKNVAGGDSQFLALYNFYTETIKSTIGFRGVGLQLKVERASSIADFRALREQYLEAVLKAKGNEMAQSLGDRLDRLLSAG
jgi:hypothetical protein